MMKGKYRVGIVAFILYMILMSVMSSLPHYAQINRQKMDYIVQLVENNFIGDISEKQLEEGAFKGILSTLDEYSKYFTAQEYQVEGEMLSGEFAGVGISMLKDEKTGYIYIDEVYDNTPAHRAGLMAGDFITAVDGKLAKDYNLEELGDMLRGEPQTSVICTIMRDKNPETFEVNIVRDIVKISSVEVKYLEKDHVIHIIIEAFNEGVADDLKEQLLQVIQDNEQNIRGLVLDLRDNPGGFVNEAVQIADMFIPEGAPIYHADYKIEEDDHIYAKQKMLYDDKVAVLINAGSASASELLAGALQDVGLARVFGEQSFGKGIMQATVALNEGDAIEFTIAEYFTANHHKVHKIGITPDVKVVNSPKISIKHFAPIIEHKTYQKNDMGLNIYAVQQRLMALGYDVEVNAGFDDKTDQALIKFMTDYSQQDMPPYQDGMLSYPLSKKIDEIVINITQHPKDKVLETAISWMVKND